MDYAPASHEFELPVAHHHPVGASTGFMTEERGDWSALAKEAWRISRFAAEFSALDERELDGLIAYLKTQPSLPFFYLSVHGPSKGRKLSESALVEKLVELTSFCSGIVMHPDTIEDPEAYRSLGRKLLIENMDSRKGSGRTVEELVDIFGALPDAGFCFDIAHAWSMDASMKLGGTLLDAFAPRLCQLHVSSLSQDLRHVPLSEDDEELFAPLLRRCIDVPWILEAPPR